MGSEQMAERASFQLTQLLRGAYGSLQHKQSCLHLLCLQLQLVLLPWPTWTDSISPKPVVVGVRGSRYVETLAGTVHPLQLSCIPLLQLLAGGF